MSVFQIWDPENPDHAVNQVYELAVSSKFDIPRLRDSLASEGKDVLRDMFLRCGGTICSSYDPMTCDEIVTVGHGNWRVSYMMVEDDSKPPRHFGGRVPECSGYVFYGSAENILAEAILMSCQDMVADKMLIGDRTTRYMQHFMNGKGLTHYHPWEYFREFGLSKHRTDMLQRMLCAMGCLNGDLKTDSRKDRVLFRQKTKLPRVVEFERSEPVSELFEEVDADASLSSETIRQFDEGLEGLLGNGMLISLKNKGVSLRIRKIGDLPFGGAYYPSTRNIVLDPSGIRFFTHEYGHALDYSRSLSSSDGFADCYSAYCRNVSSNPAFKADYLKYLTEHTEVFARLFERYVFLNGISAPLNITAEDREHPLDPVLDAKLIRYFDDLLERTTDLMV